MLADFSSEEIKIFRRLNTPSRIQDFLDELSINFETKGETIRSPRRVIRDRTAHCLEGALLAAVALWFHGEKPLLLDLRSRSGDDDHVVALFRRFGYWGAISKTNHATLRYREPIFRNIRELAISYFHEYFLDNGAKTLREYSAPFDLRGVGKDWITSEKDLWSISKKIDQSPHESILSWSPKYLRRADGIEIAAGKMREWYTGRKERVQYNKEKAKKRS